MQKQETSFNIKGICRYGLLLLVFAKVGCGGDVCPTEATPPPSPTASLTAAPMSLTLAQGQTKPVVVTVTRHNSTGSGSYRVAGIPELDACSVTPATATTVPFAAGEFEKAVTFQVLAKPNTLLTSDSIRFTLDSVVLASVPVTIGSNVPDFTFRANATTLGLPIYTESAAITFTLTSVGGYSGSIRIDAEPDGPIGEDPLTTDTPIVLGAGQVKTFTRMFTRFPGATTNNFLYIARDVATNRTKQVTITLQAP